MPTAIVLCGPEGGADVLGIRVALRAVLSLQAAGCDAIKLLGPGANDVWAATRGDERVKANVDVVEGFTASGEGALVIARDVLIDPAFARNLSALAGNAVVRAYNEAILAGRTVGDVRGEESLAALPAAKCAGVAIRAATPIEARAAETALLASLRKPQDGWVSYHINRPISLSVTRALSRTGLRPNHLSGAILVVGLVGAAFALRGDHGALLFGALFFNLQSILDGCDGELSRLHFRGSKLGEWLDTIGDDVTNYSFFACATLGISSHEGAFAWLRPLGLFGVLIGMAASAIEYRYLYSIGSGDLLKYPLGFGKDPEPAARPGPIAVVLGKIRPAFKRDFFVFATLIAAVLGPKVLSFMIALFSIGAALTFGAVVASELRRAKEKRDEPPPPPPPPPPPKVEPAPPVDLSVDMDYDMTFGPKP